ncbi:type II secretion system protein [Litoribrevibacter albus]|uniref:MSHA biogenesis protein MshO n=1 Tax=Litoribrevibacter albus TaxID=1473156 RepID=A0AA37W878_9GAMM|nr:type II secretion system protein [Litoribrevibacter albus]GLQ33505.1 MSHA biogenesis protein MshO [Litoribrevibacter albus]
MRTKPVNGFTLIELVIVITIAGIVAVLAATMIGNQMTAFVDLSRRAVLVDQAETAVRQMTRDIRAALPNSLRVTTNSGNAYLELVPIKDAGRYRLSAGDGTVTDDDKTLDFSVEDTDFQVLGRLPTVEANDRLVIYNIGQVNASDNPVNGANVYADPANNSASSAVPVLGSHVISDAGDALSYTGTNSNVMTLNSGHQFAFQSPQQRFYVVNQALSYVCDLTNQRIRRYEGYDLQAAQPNNLLGSPLSGASIRSTLIENVTDCEFSYNAGNAQRSGLLTITLTVAEDGERVRLVHQVHVDNAP